jgi:hypothetical protein
MSVWLDDHVCPSASAYRIKGRRQGVLFGYVGQEPGNIVVDWDAVAQLRFSSYTSNPVSILEPVQYAPADTTCRPGEHYS